MRTPRMPISASCDYELLDVSDLSEKKSRASNHMTVYRKKHSYIYLITVYSIGIFLGALFALCDTDWKAYILLFWQTRLNGFLSSSAAQILAGKLHTACLSLLVILFLYYSALGSPLLLAMVCGNGFIRTVDLICVFSQISQLGFGEYLYHCFLYDFGRTFIFIPLATEVFFHSNRMFHFFFMKKRFPEAQPFSASLLLGTFIGVLSWCLLVYALSSLFSSLGR